MVHTHDVLIIGRGLAGAVLAETLLQRGLRVHVYDRRLPGNASSVAAGVVNPVVMRRDVPSWRALDLLPVAEAFYGTLEQRLNTRFWYPMELVKLFPDAGGAAQWERAMRDPVTVQLVDRRPQPGISGSAVKAEHGHGTVTRSAWLDVPLMLHAQRERWMDQDVLTEVELRDGDVERLPGGVRIGPRYAPWIVWCTGPFSKVKGLVPVKGEGLTMTMPGLPNDRMVHRGVFALPVGDGRYKVGATFRWDRVWEGPTEEARAWLLDRLSQVTNTVPKVVDQWAGVRPTSRDRRPLLGRVAGHEAVFNGLGARGVLLAPWCARHLAAHLFEGSPLDPEVDVARSL